VLEGELESSYNDSGESFHEWVDCVRILCGTNVGRIWDGSGNFVVCNNFSKGFFGDNI